MEIHPLTVRDAADSPAFRSLMSLASGKVGQELETMLRARSADDGSADIGAYEGARPLLVGFASWRTLDEDAVLDYIAVSETHQGRKIGTRLIKHIQDTARARSVIAETDDDAVDFYRRLGFNVEAGITDQRYPGVSRYRCTLTRAAARP